MVEPVPPPAAPAILGGRAGAPPTKAASSMSDTLAVHAGVVSEPATGAMLTPIFQSTAYQQHSVERYAESGFTYSRCANPTVAALERKIAALENSTNPAVTFGTGMAATNCVFAALAETGDHVIITRCSYGGTNRAARVLWGRQFGIDVEFVDFKDLKALEAAIRPGKTRLVLSETPCNPVLELADLRAISDICQRATAAGRAQFKPEELAAEPMGAGEGPPRHPLRGRVIHVADTTLAPPPVMRGLDFGPDVLLISLTKFYCGHNQHLGGALLSNDSLLYEHIRFKQNVMGSIMTPNTAFAMLQTATTMSLRLRKQSESALRIAAHLEKHPKVKWVRYPGLRSHEQYAVAQKQHLNGLHGALVALDIEGGAEAGRRVMNACEAPWTLAENLGALQSIMTCPSVFTHSNMTKEAREAAGITDGLIRLSVGIEDTDDLIAALDHALQHA